MISLSIDDLFARTLAGDYDDDAPWEAVDALRRIGSREVFDRATEWCASTNPLARARGCDVLAQLGCTVEHPAKMFADESFSLVSRMVGQETELRPLRSAIYALGHLDRSAAVPLILSFRSHSDAGVRYAAAFALGCYPDDAGSVQGLLALMEDADANVRDWATFGLGVQGNADSPEIREALLRRLSDEDDETREEAMAGLAKRRDISIIPAVIAELDEPPANLPVLDAAASLLDIEEDLDDWDEGKYAAALRHRFNSQTRVQ